MTDFSGTEAQAPVVVIGLGRSGIGAAKLLLARGERPLVLEQGDSEALRAQARSLAAEGLEVRLNTPLNLERLTTMRPSPRAVVISPGLAWNHPVLTGLRQAGIAVLGEAALAWEASESIPWIAITGTNGKTTVTHLIQHLLSSAGLDAPLCGNVGTSVAAVLAERLQSGQAPPAHLVVELSSYQIEAAAAIRPTIGLWTTLTPDHLERHGSLASYRAIKHHLLAQSAVRILNGDDPDLQAHAGPWPDSRWITAGPAEALPRHLQASLWIEPDADGRPVVMDQRGPLFPAGVLAMPGDHNRRNLLMATAVGLELGLDPRGMADAFRRFPGVPHRLERIRDLAGITWFNDSKATNYDAAAVALEALDGPLVVLAGGQSKQGEASGWLQRLEERAAAVVLFGASRPTFFALLKQHGYSGRILEADGLNEAVPLALQAAQELSIPTVLLSPACASFDQYSDFEARGDHFRTLVLAL
ncbi:MAG: UDP-N-acetylmuramoyl-L-alanine--D-glutamate ligase [Cyanobacteriota bacterium]